VNGAEYCRCPGCGSCEDALAARRRSTFRVRWSRGDGQVHECAGLTAALLVRRLRNAIASNGGKIEVHEVEREVQQ
jgi:hypothetical protein